MKFFKNSINKGLKMSDIVYLKNNKYVINIKRQLLKYVQNLESI